MATHPGPETEHPHPQRVVKVHEAKTRLSSLLREVEAGHEITIARGSAEVARLVPVAAADAPRRRPTDFLRYRLPDSFFDELPEEELRAWEGDA